MNKPNKLFNVLTAIIFSGVLLGGVARAESIAWVTDGADNRYDSLGVHVETPFWEMLEAAGYELEVLVDTMQGNPLTTEQFDLIESFDLIIFGRGTNSGDYNDPMGWNSVTKPIILNSVYLSRSSRWMWFNTEALIGVSGGRSGAPPFKVQVADHPIFTGVTPDADGMVYLLDPEIGCGNTSLANVNDVGDDATVIATSVNADSMGAVDDAAAIVYWPTDAQFHPDVDQFAGAPRLLFPCGTQEDAGQCDLQAEYNLTPDGATVFMNAVAWMLGKEVGVDENPSTIPAGYELAQNYPNPFNPSTTISFTVPSTATAKLAVYNMLGQQVASLANQIYQAGTHAVSWDGLDTSGQPVESGIYLYRLETENVTLTKKMLMIK